MKIPKREIVPGQRSRDYGADRPATPEELAAVSSSEAPAPVKKEKKMDEFRKKIDQAIKEIDRAIEEKALDRDKAMLELFSNKLMREEYRKAGYDIKLKQGDKGEVERIELRNPNGGIRFYYNVKELEEEMRRLKEDGTFIN